MSRIACAWAELGEDANDAYHWYETTHIPDALVKIRSTARHAEQVEDSPFQEVPGIDGRFMTIYDLPKQPSAQDLDARICPALDKLPNEAKVDTRFYTEHKNWFGEEWRGDPRDVQMWVVVLWQPAPEVHDEFVKWFGEEFTPGMLESPGLLRTRIFKLEHASLIQDEKYKQVDKASVYQYMTFWEFDSEELPWEILVYLGSSERWRHYVEGGLLSWQVGQFLVNNIYPDIEDADSPAVMGAKIIVTPVAQET
ncbi:uncharacterized protein J4E88_009988 [Alternaria novae-zelandiae]|uniref:uncharacterized protein n=1 Tax=Alternaria metachromatica TaxID=283354 RepID=UPI0020C28099|nr:uncharacterized protein J4E83_010847 [Alternaria metachromatica]XP_049205472.1 uncharacterized protein J4E79_011284 [Alternaria viburni]XP_049239675.1 uncharacterized protein J4E84_010021 [Alternaria hordeiaustralica]XP_049250747.1 uncharacterized protein J4E88_009988 [Alternaria novae-zelandiae]XP_051320391.1 uncharacterized protein J4E85_011619 [Alternaria conjuncta]KAI4605111.1 hypothetical protein J4E83_010847 [Alternaria metachromatica]KAI4643343.1 hypothetical protein J4E79_011284 [A